jgi:hypothetical protein
MRVVPAHGAQGSQVRELRGPELRWGGRRVRRSAFPLCIAGGVLQITETTEKKLSGIPSGPHRMELRRRRTSANVRHGWKADVCPH